MENRVQVIKVGNGEWFCVNSDLDLIAAVFGHASHLNISGPVSDSGFPNVTMKF